MESNFGERHSVEIRREKLGIEKPPDALSDVKLYDVKQAKAALLSSRRHLASDQSVADSDLAEFLTTLGANLFARASVRVLAKNTASLLSISDQSTVIPDSKKVLHHLRGSKNIIEISVPSHVVPKVEVTPGRCREISYSIAQDRLLVEKKKNADEMRKQTRINLYNRVLSRLPVIDSLSIRVTNDNTTLEQSVQARMQLEHRLSVMKSKISIIVIGAGLAGLSAADQLLSFGFSNVVVLEALDRVGGRIYSVPLSDPAFEYLEIGVPYVDHANEGNSVYALVKQSDLGEETLNKCSTNTTVVCANSIQMKTGGITDLLLPCQLMQIDTNLIFSYIKSNYCANVNLGYQDYIRERYRRLVHNKNHVITSRLISICQMVNELPFDGKSPLGGDNSKDFAVNLRGFHQDNGGTKIALSMGMSALLDNLTAKLNSNRLRLNTRVQRIEWHHSCSKHLYNTKITCYDGRIFNAHHVIVAVPLGHLKENADTMFEPALPAHKIDVIKRVGFGTVSKVYLCYEDPFWSEPFSFIWPGTEGITEILWSQTLKFTSLENHHSILEVHVLGIEVETMLDSQIEQQLTAILSFYFGTEITKPVQVRKSKWFSNPLFRGTHPYLSTQSSERDHIILGEPLNCGNVPVVLFAGDYTYRSYLCLTHAAHASGVREAHRLQNIYNTFHGFENTNP